MKNIFKTGKRSIAAILTVCILLGISGICVYAGAAITEETATVTEETTQELVPVMARGCKPTTLSGWMDKYSSIYGFTYNNTGLGYNKKLSNGYYYHAYAQTNYYLLFLYDSTGTCIETERFYVHPNDE